MIHLPVINLNIKADNTILFTTLKINRKYFESQKKQIQNECFIDNKGQLCTLSIHSKTKLNNKKHATKPVKLKVTKLHITLSYLELQECVYQHLLNILKQEPTCEAITSSPPSESITNILD